MKKILMYLNFLMVINAQSGFFTQNISPQISEGVAQPLVERYQMSSQRYHTDKEGNILMFVNVWGHVNKPGRIMVDEGIDVATLLSITGGPKKGANMKHIRVYREFPDEDGNFSHEINLENFIDSGNRDGLITILPNDTYIISQTWRSWVVPLARRQSPTAQHRHRCVVARSNSLCRCVLCGCVARAMATTPK